MRKNILLALLVFSATAPCYGEGSWIRVEGVYSDYDLGRFTDNDATYRGHSIVEGSTEGKLGFGVAIGVSFKAR
jgi:hypothetical protein